MKYLTLMIGLVLFTFSLYAFGRWITVPPHRMTDWWAILAFFASNFSWALISVPRAK